MNIQETLTLLFLEEYTYKKEDRNPSCIIQITLSEVERRTHFYKVNIRRLNGYGKSFRYKDLEEAKKQIKYLKSLVSKRNGVIKYGS